MTACYEIISGMNLHCSHLAALSASGASACAASTIYIKVTGLLKFRKLHFLCLSPVPFWRTAYNWWLILIVWDLVYSFSEADFLISFYESYHFAECRHFAKFKWPYFHTACGYSHMLGHGGSSVCIVHVDMTLTQSKVNIKVTGLLKFHKLHFSMSISSAILACSLKLIVGIDSMGPCLQLVWARFLNFLLGKLSRSSNFTECWHIAIFLYCMRLQ